MSLVLGLLGGGLLAAAFGGVMALWVVDARPCWRCEALPAERRAADRDGSLLGAEGERGW